MPLVFGFVVVEDQVQRAVEDLAWRRRAARQPVLQYPQVDRKVSRELFRAPRNRLRHSQDATCCRSEIPIVRHWGSVIEPRPWLPWGQALPLAQGAAHRFHITNDLLDGALVRCHPRASAKPHFVRQKKGPSVSNPRQRALILAVQMLGGEAAASDTLDTSTGELSSWLGGRLDPPVSLLMRALDVILDDPAFAARAG